MTLLHPEATGPASVSPLAAILEKETELRLRLEAARRQAEAGLQAARQEAGVTVAQAEQAARAEAKALFEQGLVATQQEIEALLAAAQAEADALHHQVMPRLDDAAAQIARLALPCPSAPA